MAVGGTVLLVLLVLSTLVFLAALFAPRQSGGGRHSGGLPGSWSDSERL